MLDNETCKLILEKDGEHFTKEEIELITHFLWEMADISASQFLKQTNQYYEEKSDFDG